MVRTLFIGGPPRSGTSALADYLNLHEEVLVCMERFKHIQARVDPGLFTFERILDYVPQREGGETNTPREYHEELLAKKNPEKLAWIGDKFPGYVRSLGMLYENNPGARFILAYRPLDEVAESFEARSKNPDDPWLGGRDGFGLGIKFWNLAMRSAREFVEHSPDPNVLVVSYHDFFYNSESYIPLLSRFLEIEFDDPVREAWKRTSRDFEGGRRRKESLTEEQISLIENGKDYAAEQWIMDRIERQWEDPGLYSQRSARSDLRREFAAGIDRENVRGGIVREKTGELERETDKLRRSLDRERRKTESLRARNRELSARARNLQRHLESVKNSRSWMVLEKIRRLGLRILGSGGG